MYACRAVVIIFGCGVLSGCDKSPATISSNAPPLLFSTAHEFDLAAKVKSKSGEELPDARPAYSVTPAETATVTSTGALKCLKSGNGTVLITAGTATKSEPFKCRLVESIRLPGPLKLIIPNAPVEVDVAAVGGDGTALSDVPVQLSPSDATVVAVVGRKLSPLSVGATTIRVEAGDKSESFEITVVKKVHSAPLLLNDGNRVSVSLGQGKYDAEVKVRSGGTNYGVTLSWVGGSGCEETPEAQTITSHCDIDNAGSLIISNPTAFGMGPAADGVLTVYMVP